VLQGPTYSATINGGECEISDEDGSVECEEPFIELSSTPYICNLPFRGQVKVEVRAHWLQQHTTWHTSILPSCMCYPGPRIGKSIVIPRTS
jgi:hypothetical protein